MTIGLDELESLARAATPGPWHQSASGTLVLVDDAFAEVVARVNRLVPVRDAEYIAALSPGATLDLIAELRATRKLLDFERRHAAEGIGNAVRSELAAVERAEKAEIELLQRNMHRDHLVSELGAAMAERDRYREALEDILNHACIVDGTYVTKLREDWDKKRCRLALQKKQSTEKGE